MARKTVNAADRDERVVVSADTDFGTGVAMGHRRPPSVLLLRVGEPAPNRAADSLLHSNLPAVVGALDAGSVVVVEEALMRIVRDP